MAAMREGVGLPQRSGRVRAVFAAVCSLGGPGGDPRPGSSAGPTAATPPALLGLGAGADVPRRRAVQPAARPAAGAGRRRAVPARSASPAGWRARTRPASRGRTAATAAALMVGLALVTFVSIFAAGFRGVDRRGRRPAVRRRPDRAQQGRLLADPRSRPATASRASSGVGSVTGVRFARLASSTGEDALTIGVDPADLAEGYKVTCEGGHGRRPARPGEPTRWSSTTSWAEQRRRRSATPCGSLTSSGERRSLKVVGSLDEDDAGLLGGGILVANDELERHWDERRDAFLFLDLRATGSTRRAARQARRRACSTTQFPSSSRRTARRSRRPRRARSTRSSYLFYALLALSIIVSLFGVVNTLTLSIHERTRELGDAAGDRHEPPPGAAHASATRRRSPR